MRAAIAVRRKDTHRIKEDIQVSGGKPNIESILWNEMRLRGVTCRPMDGNIHLGRGTDGIYHLCRGREHTPVQWLEVESSHFRGMWSFREAEEEYDPGDRRADSAPGHRDETGL